LVNFRDLKLIKLDNKGQFDEYFNRFPPPHSDYSFVTMICWQHYMKYKYTFVDDSLIILTKCKDKLQLRPPMGSPDTDLDDKVLNLAAEKCSEPPFGMVDNRAKERLSNVYPNVKFEGDMDFYDYVYSADELAKLAGKKYIKMRNLANRIKRRYDYKVEPITLDNIEDIKALLQRWCLWKDCDKIPLLESEKRAIQYCMNHFFELGVFGVGIKINGDFEAVSIYEPINEDSAIIHFEKAIPDYDGLYQVINQETAIILSKNHKFINRESDMGFPGLRLAKKKYRPHHMNEVYHVNKHELLKILK
jgi:hypothetical protein